MKNIRVFLIGIILYFLVISQSSYANRPSFDTTFFQDIGDIYISVIVINGDEKHFHELASDQTIFNTEIAPREIKRAIFESFKSQFKDTGIKVFGTGELMEINERLKIPDADSSDFSDAPESKNIEILAYVAITHQSLDDGKEIVFGAITTKTLKDQIGKFKKTTDLRLEGLSQPFMIFSNKQKTLEEIQDKTARVFETQRRWILCKKLQKNIPCSDEGILLEKFREAEKNAGQKMALKIKARVSLPKLEQLKKSCGMAKENDPKKREFEPIIGQYIASKSGTEFVIGDDFNTSRPRPPKKQEMFAHRMVWLTEKGYAEVLIGAFKSDWKEFFSKVELVLGTEAIRQKKDAEKIFGICALKDKRGLYSGNLDYLMNMEE